mgnify:CR=1 FL=1
MNNLITINFTDPIREEYNQAIDKTAALNTIAFKYFKGCLLYTSPSPRDVP